MQALIQRGVNALWAFTGDNKSAAGGRRPALRIAFPCIGGVIGGIIGNIIGDVIGRLYAPV